MSLFQPGDAVRTKSGGPRMTVDAYTTQGEVLCTYWDKGKRKQERFVEATLEIAPPPTAPGIYHLGSGR